MSAGKRAQPRYSSRTVRRWSISTLESQTTIDFNFCRRSRASFICWNHLRGQRIHRVEGLSRPAASRCFGQPPARKVVGKLSTHYLPFRQYYCQGQHDFNLLRNEETAMENYRQSENRFKA